MPRGDGTGPAGMGPMTGRAAGYCAGYDRPGFTNPAGGRMGAGFGWGRGRGMGYGRGMGRWGYPAAAPYNAPYNPYGQYGYTPEQEKEILQNQAKSIENELKQIQKRLSDLEAESKEQKK